MNFKNPIFIVLAIVLSCSGASAAEAVWPKNSASDLSIFVASMRFRIYAEYCSVRVPQLKPQFEILVENLNARIAGISKGLLATDIFDGMNDKPVPAAIINAFEDSLHDSKHNLERREAASVCPKALQNFGEMDDESLRSDLTDIFTAVQTMIQNLEKESAR